MTDKCKRCKKYQAWGEDGICSTCKEEIEHESKLAIHFAGCALTGLLVRETTMDEQVIVPLACALGREMAKRMMKKEDQNAQG